MDLAINILGWCGACAVLLAYAMVSTRRVQGDAFSYQSMNVAGASLLTVNTLYNGAYPSTFVNIIWIGIAVVALSRRRSQL